MLAAEDYSDISACGALPRTELPEVHRSKISLHHAKADYRHPTIRLPHTFSKLAGLPTRIYQTLHEGALAFLVVIACFHSATEDKVEKSKNIVSDSVSRAFTRRGPRVRISPSPLITGTFFDSEAKIVSDDEEEELATSEELPTSADDNEERKEEQANEYTVDLGYGYVNYYRGLDGKLRSREYLAEELIDEDVSGDDLREQNRPR